MTKSHVANSDLTGSPSLNCLVAPEQLAHFQEWSIRDDGPFPYVVCPFCGRGKLYYAIEPLRGGAYWFCDHCKWSGTSISLYQEVNDNGLEDTYSTWQHLKNSLNLHPQPPWDSQDKVTDYKLWQRGQDRIRSIVKSMANRMADNLPSRAVNTLEQLGAWGGWTVRNFRTELGYFVGCASSYDIKELASLAFEPSSGAWARMGYNMSLAIPQEILPGLYGRILFLSEGREARWVDLQPTPGVIGYSSSLCNIEHAVVIPNIQDFLVFQRQWLTSRGTKIPLVSTGEAINAASGRDLARLPHKQINVWDYEDASKSSIFLIDCARTIGSRGYIATEPTVVIPKETEEKDFNPLCFARNVSAFMKEALKSPVHWTEILRDFLIYCSTPDAVAQLRYLDPPMNPDELDMLKEVCTNRQWESIQAHTRQTGGYAVFQYGKHSIIERPGQGWFRVNPNPGRSVRSEERVSNAVIELKNQYTDGDAVVVSGTMRIGNDTISFSDYKQKIRVSPLQYFEKLAVDAGLNLSVMARWGGNLLRLAEISHPPNSIPVPDRIGWNANKNCWDFLGFTIHPDGNYTAIPQDFSLPAHKPGRGILTPEGFNSASMEWWAANRPEVEISWTFVIATLYNLSAKYAGNSPMGYLFDAESAPVAVEHMDLFGQSLGLRRYRINRGSDNKVDEVTAEEKKNDLPVLFSCEKSKALWWRSWLRHNLPHNVIFAGSPMDAMQAMAGNGWVFISGEWLNLPSAVDEPPQAGILVSLLLPTFAELVKEKSIGEAAAEAVTKVCYKTVPKVVQSAIDRMVSCPPTAWERLLWLLFAARDEGVLSISGKESSPLWRDSNGSIRVHWNRVHRTLAKHNVQLPDAEDLDEAEKHFKGIHSHPDGWWIDQTTWESNVAKWRRVFPLIDKNGEISDS